jgi:hypothetical protein
MSERQYNVGKWEHYFPGRVPRAGGRHPKKSMVLCYKTWVTLPEARKRLAPNGGRGDFLVYRDISDPKVSREPWSGRLYLYNNDRALFDKWDNREDWDRYDEYSIGEGEPLESWATRLFEVMGPDRAKSVHRALSKVLHPDNQYTGDETLFRELNGAYEKHIDPETGIWLDNLFNFGMERP